MPLLLPSDIRHPVNLERIMHGAMVDVVGAGGFVPLQAARVLVKAGTAVKDRRDVMRYLEDMEDRYMVRLEKGTGVTVLPEAGVILPPGWLEPSSQAVLAQQG